MEFKKGDVVTVLFPSNFKSKYIREKYEGSVHEVIEVNYDGWVKLSECSLIHWWHPGFIVRYTGDEDEEIELQDLLSIM